MLKQYLLKVYQLVGQVVNVVFKKIRKKAPWGTRYVINLWLTMFSYWDKPGSARANGRLGCII